MSTTTQKPMTLSKHPEYMRWAGMISRYVVKTLPTMRDHVKVCVAWAPPAETGFKNFVAWIEDELVKHPEIERRHFTVKRINQEDDYYPGNCYLQSTKATNSAVLEKHRAKNQKTKLRRARVAGYERRWAELKANEPTVGNTASM